MKALLVSPEFWSLVGSLVSIILGAFAIVLSIYFFVQSKKTEQSISVSLAKIEAQTDALQKIAGRQLDRLTKYVTQSHNPATDDALAELIPVLKDLPKSLLGSRSDAITPTPGTEDAQELLIAYGALYFYIGQANFWSQLNLPSAAQYDPTQPIQSEAKTIVDLSAQDFNYVAEILGKKDVSKLNGTSIEPMVSRTKDFWRTTVRNSSDVFLLRGKQEAGQ